MNIYLRGAVWLFILYGIANILINIYSIINNLSDSQHQVFAIIYWLIVELLLITLLKRDNDRKRAAQERSAKRAATIAAEPIMRNNAK